MYKHLKTINYWLLALPVITLATFSCNYSKPQLTPDQVATVQKGVTDFTTNLAGDLTARGPIAWEDYIDTSANFFMADVGQLVFKSGPSAKQFIQDTLSKSISKINLKWSNMRIDPLTPTIAAVGSDYHEDITNSSGASASYDGYFSATVLLTDGKWKIRDAHWSEKGK